MFGDVMVAYRAEYPHLTENDTVGRIESVRFDDPLPELLRWQARIMQRLRLADWWQRWQATATVM